MKKSEIKGIVALVIMGLVCYPFILFYQTFGIWGFAIPLAIAICYFFFKRSSSGKEDQMAFEELIIDTLHLKIPPPEWKKINTQLSKINFPRAALLRNIQIIADSINISLKSKKREIAESRMEAVLKGYKEIKLKQLNLISEETFKTITTTVKYAEKRLSTLLYTNIAMAHLDKVGKLKTEKSKIKYLGLAKEILQEGLENKLSNKDKLEKLFSKVIKIEESLSA